jgi:hypothetical protein
MSYFVTRLVRAVRLPRTLAHRSATKGVLLALADDCQDDGRDAYTARSTIALEAAISPDTVDAHLKALQALGLISIQHKSRQHHPNIWRLHLPVLAALTDAEAVKKLNDDDQALIANLHNEHRQREAGQSDSGTGPTLRKSDSGPVPTLNTQTEREPAQSDSGPVPTLNGPASEFGNPDWEFSSPDSGPVPTERYENGTENKDRTSAQTPSFTRQAKEPNGTNFFVIRTIAIAHLKTTGTRPSFADLVEAVKQKCADLAVDYGRDPAVPIGVVHRACTSAEFEVFLKPKVGIRSDAVANDPE